MTLLFAGFALVTLIVYYFLRHRQQNRWLLITSLLIYVIWAPEFVFGLLVVSLANLYVARAIAATQDRLKARLLWIGIGLNIFLLVYLKYADFFVPQSIHVLSKLGIGIQSATAWIIFPIGLSYMVVQLISYLVDVYRGQMEPAINYGDFTLYLVYFPKLIAGPIERARAFLPKLQEPRIVDNEQLARSVLLIVVGLLRKFVIADLLSVITPASIWVDPTPYKGRLLLVYLIAYSFLIYNDFAGYTNIARGISGLFGIELTPNFRTPYFARNFTEFWNRWHISLSNWLRDYIFFPITRALLIRNPNRRNVINFVIPPVATMLVSALWHQAALNMLLWGLLHGIYQVIERIWAAWRPVRPPDKWPMWRQALGMIIVISFATLAWIPFRAPLPVAFVYLHQMLGAFFTSLPVQVPWRLIVLVSPSLLIDWLQYRLGEFGMLKWPRLAQATALSAALILVFLVTTTNFHAPPFIYRGF